MEIKFEWKLNIHAILKWLGAFSVLVGLCYLAFNYYELQMENIHLHAVAQESVRSFEAVTVLKDSLALELKNEQIKNGTYVNKIDEVTNKANKLEKILNTDKELLQKYSKVFFLNEHYTPSNISDISPTLLTTNSKALQIHSKVLPYLEKMILASRDANNPIQIVSAYRSFGTQASLKTAYKSTFGSGANKFSADQGYSEHQLGTTVDLTTPILQNTFVSFEKTPAFKWLAEHAHEYGFTLSYPKNNKYYSYEPWHWRFVGIKLATKLHDESKYFYDLDQREIDDYLLTIFD